MRRQESKLWVRAEHTLKVKNQELSREIKTNVKIGGSETHCANGKKKGYGERRKTK